MMQAVRRIIPLVAATFLLVSLAPERAAAKFKEEDTSIEDIIARETGDLPDGGTEVGAVAAAEATAVEIEAMAETGYRDEQGRYVVDLLERDYAYLAVRLQTPEGRPVKGAEPVFSLKGTSTLVPPKEVSPETTTDESGVVEFAVVGGKMGLDSVSVKFGETNFEFLVNVISLKAAGLPELLKVEGAVPWEELMRAHIRYDDNGLVAEFPPSIAERAGKKVKLSGFMLPLDPDFEQRRFLFASNPPSCFFHVPGGPAGAVEVFAPEGIGATLDPLVLEGRFEPQKSSEVGVVYRLHDARLVTPE